MTIETWVRSWGFNNRLRKEIVLQIGGRDHALSEEEAERLAQDLLRRVKEARESESHG